MEQPDRELWDIVTKIQAGDEEARWGFSEHPKIKTIIRGRLRQYRRMFPWISTDTIEDVGCSLRPRLIELAQVFQLPEQANDGRIISYFSLRIKGEADFLLKKLTGMRQVVDEDGTVYFKSFDCNLDDNAEILPDQVDYIGNVVDSIDANRQRELFNSIVNVIPEGSNDFLWLRCYGLRQYGLAWADIAKQLNQKPSDIILMKENTTRFVNRLRNQILLMGEQIGFRICGIFTDVGEVAICVYDPTDKKKRMIWSKTYSDFEDLDKIEAKIGDVLRQYDITYIVCNMPTDQDRAHIIVMRYLTKREAYVYLVDLSRFVSILPSMPNSIDGISATDAHKCAYLLAQVKLAHLDHARSLHAGGIARASTDKDSSGAGNNS